MARLSPLAGIVANEKDFPKITKDVLLAANRRYVDDLAKGSVLGLLAEAGVTMRRRSRPLSSSDA